MTEAPQQVHQSDLDGIKGLYLINAGDEVTQFLFVSASRSTTISTDRWGWGGYTTHDLHRCQLTARAVALAYNWWSLFVRAAHPEARLEAVTSRPLLLTGISEKTRHARQARLTITPVHGKGGKAKALLMEASALLHEWKRIAEQLTEPGILRLPGLPRRTLGQESLLQPEHLPPRDAQQRGPRVDAQTANLQILQHGDARKFFFARGHQRHLRVSLVVAVKHARVTFLKCGRVTVSLCAYIPIAHNHIMSNMTAKSAIPGNSCLFRP